MMRSKEFYEGSISRLQKMVKHGVYVLLFDVFAVAVQIPFIFAGKWLKRTWFCPSPYLLQRDLALTRL